jgi:ATP-dependent exoDNAse (exonuclease V) alpha subunit
VAIYFLNIKFFGRSTGGRATYAAAYRAGERIRDERTGEVFDHSRRADVMHKQIVLPTKHAAADMSWARDRSVLWNAAELAESRRNARVAREYLVALPHELTNEERLALVRRFSQDLADRHGFAVDFAIHAPPPDNDPRNFHAHLLTTTREVAPTGLGAKTDLDIGSARRQERGLCSQLKELYAVRERWATFTNEALQEANLANRVDHRSLMAQGVDREPRPRIPVGAWRSERQGQRSDIAERIRSMYHARIQARLERAVARASAPGAGGKLDDVRRLARQSWLQLREAYAPRGAPAAPNAARAQARGSHPEEDLGRTDRDDDLGL